MNDLAETALGKRMHSQSFALHGRMDESAWRQFLVDCAEAMAMTPAGAPAIWNYPVDGKGGSGKTILQPITESFLVIDTWPDHDGAYLFVCSCRRFDAAQLQAPIQKWGLRLDDISGSTVLRLG